jgi:hypothetical protein
VDENERMAKAAGKAMAETYGRNLPRIGDTIWFYRDKIRTNRTCGEVIEMLGTLTPDPILVVRYTLTESRVIRLSDVAPEPDFNGRVG